MRKLGSPQKARRIKQKTRIENSTGNTDKNLRKQAKMIKQRKDAGTCKDKKKKATQEKITIKLEEINLKFLAKEGRLKRYRQRVTKMQIKQDIPKQRKKILSTSGRRWHENIPTTRCNRNRTILDWQSRKHNEKAEWINNITKEL